MPEDREIQTGRASEDLAEQICGDYADRLRRLAQSRLPGGLERRIGADDVVQSVFRTFFRRLQGGRLQVGDAEGLWNLLCAITLNKLRMQVRFHSRQRRAVQRETSIGEGSPAELGSVPAEGPDELAAFADELRKLLEGLDEDQRRVVQLKLEERTNEEIARQLGCSESTVRRRLADIRASMRRQLAQSRAER